MASSRGYCFLILLVTPLLGTCQLRLNAGCKVETLRACGQDYIPYVTSPHLHESGNEFDEGCKLHKVQISCNLKFINNCTEGISRAAALVAVQALEENTEAICNVGSDPYTEYQRDVKCLNAHGEKIHKCFKGFHNHLERAIVKGPANEVIHYACCSNYDTLDCIGDALASCETVGSKDFMFGVIEQMFGETLTLVCGKYTKGSEGCRALPELPELGAKDRRIVNTVELLLEIAGSIRRKS
ncbi:uncharacterized protein LOC119458947 [Dermacentor silvarum]|uniref:uncharacterized protein LOC119458947 n=1 Tax=Dermacentor silvarum TaxID=543639 RepID=UPI00210132BA|nr:uncharacterized protein LOC119458947 [Dermacentor silvarum]